MRVDVAVRACASLGEAPFWSAATSSLIWIDMLLGEIHDTSISTGATVTHRLNTAIGAAIPLKDELGFAVAAAGGFGFFADGTLNIHDRIAVEGYRLNDAKCDSAGRMWAGRASVEHRPGMGSLHCWDGRAPQLAATGLSLPNGIGWSPDNTAMYLADSVTHELLVADFDEPSGAVGEFRVLAHVPDGMPDGLAVGEDGSIWVAVWGAGAINRYSAQGKLIQTIGTPVSNPTSCAFGADGMLFITTARAGLTQAELAHQPLAGSVLSLDTDTRGLYVAPFLFHAIKYREGLKTHYGFKQGISPEVKQNCATFTINRMGTNHEAG